MERWQRYSATVGRGYDQFDIDSGHVHAAEYGVTACGVRIGRTVRNGGNWEQVRTYVDCKRCLKKVNQFGERLGN